MTLTKIIFPPLPFRYDVQGLVGQLEHVMPQRFQMMSNSFPNAMNGSGEVSHSACWEGGRGGGGVASPTALLQPLDPPL